MIVSRLTWVQYTYGGAASWQESYVYSNGSGGVAMTKVQAEPGDAPELEDGLPVRPINPIPTDPRWVGTGRTVLNNKGNPVKQYEPYFSATQEFEDDDDLVEWGVTPTIHYDALGRATRVDFPDGTYTKTVFGVWKHPREEQGQTVVLWPDGTHRVPRNCRADQRAHEDGARLRPSVGRAAMCFDNAVAESFWASLNARAAKDACSRRAPKHAEDLHLDRLVRLDETSFQPRPHLTHPLGTAGPSSVMTTVRSTGRCRQGSPAIMADLLR